MTCSHAFSRALRRLHVFASNGWLVALFASVVIVFGFSTLDSKRPFLLPLALSVVIIIIIISLFTLGFFRVAYAASISEHLPTQPQRPERPDHNTGNYVPYSLRTVSGFFKVPQSYLQTRVVRRGLRPYPRRLESLTICRCQSKGSTFSSDI